MSTQVTGGSGRADGSHGWQRNDSTGVTEAAPVARSAFLRTVLLRLRYLRTSLSFISAGLLVSPRRNGRATRRQPPSDFRTSSAEVRSEELAELGGGLVDLVVVEVDVRGALDQVQLGIARAGVDGLLGEAAGGGLGSGDQEQGAAGRSWRRRRRSRIAASGSQASASTPGPHHRRRSAPHDPHGEGEKVPSGRDGPGRRRVGARGRSQGKAVTVTRQDTLDVGPPITAARGVCRR